MQEIDTDHWHQLPNGEIEALPMAGWEVAAAPQLVLLRFEIETAPGRLEWLQLRVPASHASELARALQKKAKRALSTG